MAPLLRLCALALAAGFGADAALACNTPPPTWHKPPTPPPAPVPSGPPTPGSPPSAPSPPPALAVVSSGPDRAGFCDSGGRFYDLLPGQEQTAPWSSLALRPADVDATTGAIFCAAAVSAPAVAETEPAAPLLPATPTKPAKPARPAKPAKPSRPVTRRVAKKPARPKPHDVFKPHSPTLPYTP